MRIVSVLYLTLTWIENEMWKKRVRNKIEKKNSIYSTPKFNVYNSKREKRCYWCLLGNVLPLLVAKTSWTNAESLFYRWIISLHSPNYRLLPSAYNNNKSLLIIKMSGEHTVYVNRYFIVVKVAMLRWLKNKLPNSLSNQSPKEFFIREKKNVRWGSLRLIAKSFFSKLWSNYSYSIHHSLLLLFLLVTSL